MKRSTLVLIALFLVVAWAVSGCHISEPTVPSTPAPQLSVPTSSANQTVPTVPGAETMPVIVKENWDMQAVLVNEKCEVLDTVKITAEVKVWDEPYYDDYHFYDLFFWYPENEYHQARGYVPPNAAGDSGNGYTYKLTHGFSGVKGDIDSLPTGMYACFDFENKCFIAEFQEKEGVYLIASTDPDADISALWEHFQGFFELRPDEWPTISFG